jgi:hypothetical protein
MCDRAGCRGLAFFGHGHVNNNMQATYFRDCLGTKNFINNVFKITPLEFALKFDVWTVAQSGE